MKVKFMINGPQRILWWKKELVEAGWKGELEAEVNDDVIVLMRPGATLLDVERSLNTIAEDIRGRVLDEYLGRAIGKEVRSE